MEEPVPRAPQPAAAVVMAPRPKSPPKYPDVCGRRRLQLELHILNREIGFIEKGKLGQSYASTSHGFAASAGTSSGLKDQTALVHKTVAVATMGVPALSAARVLPVDHGAVVQGFLAVAQIAAKNATAAPNFLAVSAKHAAAAQKSRAVAQACLAADLSAVAGMLPPAALTAASGGLPASNHGVQVHAGISHHAPIHVAANHCAVAGGLLAVLNNGAVAAVGHNGAVPEDLHASDHAVSEIGAVV
ncbi:hypothetical protein MUK42_20675 [Musa troglodytarum]|uniref:Uncharacterized protein n=1 Tax=Musa troglodytarum TaxID=320322 RepID=A0A9E7FU78_9LILI|nr:hypothetical protein MUK42_20675 [Musa troglodytarum]